MKFCVVQSLPVRGNVSENLVRHLRMIELACAYNPEIIVFPELSLTGYEPALAHDLARDPGDSIFDELQRASDHYNITIGAGAPLRVDGDIAISMLVFQPAQQRQLYAKTYLHADEEPFFSGKQGITSIKHANMHVAFAICYELSVAVHAERAFNEGAGIYIASVAKSVAGVDAAMHNLSEIAMKYSMTVLMANAVGPADNFVCGGRSAAWNNRGELMGQLDAHSEGLLVYDTDNNGVTTVQF